MKINRIVLGSILGAVLFALGFMVAQGQPAQNVGHRHPNLMAAQRLVGQAYDKIIAAQQANEWDMGGHAAHAKELLDQANREIKMAAEAANSH